MRPQGVIRVALRQAAWQLKAQKGAATLREIAAAARVSVDTTLSVSGETMQCGVALRAARSCINDMVRAGELQVVGRSKIAGSTQWHALYAPPDSDEDIAGEPPALEFAIRTWSAEVMSGA